MTAFVDVVRPLSRIWGYLYDSIAILAGSCFLALAAQIVIPLSFTPVPITMQTFAVLVMGALLGSKRGALAVMTYLVEGAIGLPVFAGGSFGIASLLGPTGGYLVGFVVATFIIGFLLERGARFYVQKTLISLVAGTLVIHLCGALWLARFVGLSSAFTLGVVPFLIGDAIKISLASSCIPLGWKLLKS